MHISITEVEQILSKPRLRAYRNATTSNKDAICLYIRNMELSYAIYPVLQNVEVALRNTIHSAGVQHFGVADWFRDSTILTLLPREHRLLDQATNYIWDRQGYRARDIQMGNIPQPPIPAVDDHMSALPFGFWTGLLNAPYQNYIWDTRPSGVNLIHTAFAYAGRSYRQRSVIFPIVNDLRDLRNRVSHHEPIFALNPPNTPVDVQHQRALQLLGWISPAIYAITMMIDPFPSIHQRLQTHHAPNITVVP